MQLNLIEQDEFNFIKKKIESIEKQLNKKTTKSKNDLLSNQEFCRLLRITSRTAQKYRDEGKISFVQIGSKIHYTQNDVDEFLSKHRKKAFYHGS